MSDKIYVCPICKNPMRSGRDACGDFWIECEHDGLTISQNDLESEADFFARMSVFEIDLASAQVERASHARFIAGLLNNVIGTKQYRHEKNGKLVNWLMINNQPVWGAERGIKEAKDNLVSILANTIAEWSEKY